MNFFRINNKGFTFVELVVSVGIIALVSIVVVQGFFSTIRSNVKSEIIKDVKQNGDVALDTMARKIRNAQSVTTACTAGGSTTSELTVEDFDGNATTFGCAVDGSIPRISAVTAVGTNYITSRNVSLGVNCSPGVTFVCTTLPDERASIKITFSLGQATSSPDQFEKISKDDIFQAFQMTVSTRQ